MSSKSKTKGKNFEREIAKYLSQTYDDSFRRVIDSGAYTGGKNAVRRETLTEGQIRASKGDIIPPDDWVRFNCECKNYSDFPFHLLFHDREVPLLESWIAQTLEAADEGDVNIIFMKFNRKGTYVAFQLPLAFDTVRSLDYTAKEGSIWRITEFNSFFQLNKENLEKLSKE